MGFWADRKRRKAEEARKRAEESAAYLSGASWPNPYGLVDPSLGVFAVTAQQENTPEDQDNDGYVDVPRDEPVLNDSDIHTSDSPSYDSSQNSDYSSSGSDYSSSGSDYSSSSDSGSSYDSGSSGGSDF